MIETDASVFQSADEMLATIDAIEDGDAPWESFTLRYTGPINETTPSWKSATYTVYTRNSYTVMKNLLASEDFTASFDYAPYEEYTAKNKRTWSNLMSSDWAWKQAVRFSYYKLFLLSSLVSFRTKSRKILKHEGLCFAQ